MDPNGTGKEIKKGREKERERERNTHTAEPVGAVGLAGSVEIAMAH